MRKILSCFMLAAFVYAAETKAQADSTYMCKSQCCCSKEVGLPAGVLFGHVHRKKEYMLSYRYMNMAMEGIQEGGSAISANDVFTSYITAPSKMQMNSHMFMLMYGVNDRLTLMGMMSYNNNIMQMQMFDGNHTHGGSLSAPPHRVYSYGLGDLKLYGIYALVNRMKHKLIVNGGISIPTGSIEAADDNEKNLSYMMQLGSGTFDVLPGITYLYHKRISTFGIQSNTNIHLGYNKLGYSLGNEISVNAWYAYRWLKFLSSSLRAEHTFCEQLYGSDASLYYYSEPAANPNNYGGQRATVFLGSVWQPLSGSLKNWQLAAELGVPVYQNVNGIQSPLKYCINMNINVIF